jgi:transketolase
MNTKLISNGVSPGLAINPNTEFPQWAIPFLDQLDVIIIMSVNPGFAGQKFIPEVSSKMTKLIPLLRKSGFTGYFEADGGIDLSTILNAYNAGCRIFVMGNAIFGSDDIQSRLKETRLKIDTNLEQQLLQKSQSLDIKDDWVKGRKTVLERFQLGVLP